MKISNVNDKIRPFSIDFPVESKRGAEDSAGSFEQNFQDQSYERYMETVARLSEEINEQAELLTQKADLAVFQKYRLLISELVKEVVNCAYDFHKESVITPGGRKKAYSIIYIIDSRLNDLAAEILSQNAKGISLLSKVDEIRGLILDLIY